jgi:hypothetical protein
MNGSIKKGLKFLEKKYKMNITVLDSETKKVIGDIVTNVPLSFDKIMQLIGCEWKTVENNHKDGIECDGWYKNGVLYDDSTIDII